MKRKGHLCLIGGTSTSIPQDFTVSLAEVSKTDRKYSPQSRMRAAENELSAMREVTDAAFFLMRSLPMEQLELKELLDLYDMFVSGEEVLNLYSSEFAQISQMRLTPIQMKQLSRLRKLHFHLGEIIPEAADKIKEVVKLLQEQKKFSKTNSAVALQAVSTSKKPASPKISSFADKKAKGGSKSASVKFSNANKPSAVVSGKASSASKGKSKEEPNGIQLRVSLKGLHPEIWRRIHVPGDCTLLELHETIQNSMGWEDCHLHQFRIAGEAYSSDGDDLPEDEYSLDQFNLRKGSKFEYIYDFGDDWIHTVTVEGRLDKAIDYFECTQGERACPPEDSGGVYGYSRIVEILKNPKHKEYDDIVDWVGDDFDPAKFQ